MGGATEGASHTSLALSFLLSSFSVATLMRSSTDLGLAADLKPQQWVSNGI